MGRLKLVFDKGGARRKIAYAQIILSLLSAAAGIWILSLKGFSIELSIIFLIIIFMLLTSYATFKEL